MKFAPAARLTAALSLLAWRCSSFAAAQPQPGEHCALPPLREQAALQDAWTAERLALVPSLLDKHDVDAWLITQREYAEDTVFWSLKPATQFSARRRTTMLFLRQRPGSDNNENSTQDQRQQQYHHVWVDNTPSLWAHVRAALEEADPATIAVNAHPELAFSSGLHAGELEAARQGLGGRWAGRFAARPMLGVELVATMAGEGKLAWWRCLMGAAWGVIAEGFSGGVVRAGETGTEDLEWWFREKLQSLNYTTWFHPSVSIIDKDWDFTGKSPPPPAIQINEKKKKRAIQYGDMLHVDFGLSALGLNTDTQHLAYVLHPGQTSADDVPPGLVAGLRKANRAQDIVRAEMRRRGGGGGGGGRTGDEVLAASRAAMRAEGIEGLVYCHAIGDWGHSAGAVIGMTNLQDGVPVLGELPLLGPGSGVGEHTYSYYYSVELLVRHHVPEWDATVDFPVEEDVYWDGGTGSWEWAWGRQEEFHLIRTTPEAGAGGGDAGRRRVEAAGDDEL